MEKIKGFKVTGREIKYSGKWLNFEAISYDDFHGDTRHWESVNRVTKGGAVAIIAKMLKSNRIILIRQFRPPIGNYIFEFPAGLVDKGETFETTAVRELKEETGYSGIVRKMIPPVHSSPGLTDESVAIAFIEIDEDLPDNKKPVPSHEDSEDIQVYLIEQEKLVAFLKERSQAGDSVDAKLMSFSAGLDYVANCL